MKDNSVHSHRRLTRKRTIARPLTAAVSAAALFPLILTSSGPPQAAAVNGENLVQNGSFDHGMDGWRTNDKNETSVAVAGTEKSNKTEDPAAELTSTSRRTVVLNDLRNTVTDASEGARYHVEARVRATNPNLSGQLRVREVNDGLVNSSGQSFWLQDSDWHHVTLDLKTVEDGSTLDLNVLAWHNEPGHALQVDDVSMVQVAPGASDGGSPTGGKGGAATAPDAGGNEATEAQKSDDAAKKKDKADDGGKATGEQNSSPTKSTGTPAVSAGKLTNGCSYDKRGIPECGVYMGGGASDGDLKGFEDEVGRHLGVHRTFRQASQVDSAVRTARNDLANGRLPWISFKLPHSWSAMADGKGDAWARNIAERFSKLNGPVWVAFHHEPEKDGNIKQWTAIQQRLAPIVRKTAPNVAYTIILTGWNQFHGDSQYSLNSLWPDTKIDVAGFDLYNRNGEMRNGERRAGTNLQKAYFERISAWAKQKGVAWGIGETGYTDYAAKQDPGWLRRVYENVGESGGSAFAYFNSERNSTSDWRISTPQKKKQFAAVLKGSPSLPKFPQ